MKKESFYLLVALFIATWSFGFTACGNDDDSETDVVQIEPIPEELKPFIGKWTITTPNSNYYTPDYDVFFFAEKKCDVISSHQYTTNYTNHGIRDWDYDKTTKILSIAGISNAQWQLTALSDVNWSGLCLGDADKVGYAARKDTTARGIFDYYFERLGGIWINGSDTAIIGGNGRSKLQISYHYNGRQFIYGVWDWNKGSISFDSENDAIIYYVNKYSYGDVIRERVEIVHPYHYNKVYMNINLVDSTLSPSSDYFYSGSNFVPSNRQQ